MKLYSKNFPHDPLPFVNFFTNFWLLNVKDIVDNNFFTTMTNILKYKYLF